MDFQTKNYILSKNQFIKSALVLLLAILLKSSAFAQKPGLGLGVMIGEPTGISFKKWTGGSSAIGGGVAWSFYGEGSLHIHVDYLKHFMNTVSVTKGQLPLYIGLGGKINFASETQLGVRVPFGANYIFDDAPFDVFMEVVPILNLAPATDFDLGAALGARFYF
ncbi:hypothetical protein [Flexithrix dorotheae]|uniref:hypothetical protein n=1 Tax=Flexithrix dorotheae TaxID=70993 RepID=UPI0003672268|nr:hypothetical protein [Flexithrix dorotheae]